jgi:hypothetical protein
MKKFLIVFCYILLVSFSSSVDKWEFRKKENGITVHTAKIEGHQYDKCRAISTINTNLNALFSFVKDPSNYAKFSDRVEKLVIIKKTATKVVYYMSIDLPWPIYNRDGIYELTIKSKTDKEAILRIKALPDLLPVQNGYVRIQYANSYYKLTAIEANNTAIHFEQHTDPNGNVPAWLSNSYLEDGPIGNITIMKNILEK